MGFNWLWSALLFIICLVLCVMVHELGHFGMAKLSGISVPRFGLGFGPTLWSKEYKGTCYELNCIPMGGYNDIKGMDYESGDDSSDSFNAKPYTSRLAVIVAGPMMNFVLGFILLCGSFFIYGEEKPTEAGKIGVCVKQGAAYSSGLREGDIITAINGKPIKNWTDISPAVNGAAGKVIKIGYDRDGISKEVELKPVYDNVRQSYMLGIVPALDVVHYDLAGAVSRGFIECGEQVNDMFKGLGRLLRTGEGKEGLMGPVGLADMSRRLIEQNAKNYMFFIALISLNLGVVNLLPFPVLDGGHLVIISLEKALGRKLPQELVAGLQYCGVSVLCVITLIITCRDIMRLTGM